MAQRSIRSITLVAVIILLVGAALGVVAGRLAGKVHPRSDTTKHDDIDDGAPWQIENKLWGQLQTEPVTIDRLIHFLSAHAVAQAIPEDQVDTFLLRPDLPPDITQLGRFWREVLQGSVDKELKKSVEAAADRDSPAPWANRLLANEAEERGASDEAAPRYLREGRFVPSHVKDIDFALELLEELHDWPTLADAMTDPVVSSRAPPFLKARLAAETNDWVHVPKWSFLSTYPRPALAPFSLAAVAAIAWAVFCAQLGKVREKPFFRCSIYVAAFALGILSVFVTDMAILAEETKLHLVETGEPVRDALYYVFGVGFREELSKLLLFLPLLPVLRRYGKKIDVLVAGAFVGLGFAAVENLGYLGSGDLTMGVGRFLSANFLHMAMTAILASALDDFAENGDEHAPELSRTVFTVIALHGLYDFFISHPKIGGGYFSMVVFFVLVNKFLVAVESARGRSDRNDNLLLTFVVGIAFVVAVSYVWASVLVGPANAALALSGGLFGSAILVYAFARRFREM